MSEVKSFEKGQRVEIAPGQFGTVAYQRMAAPDYAHAAAVSVVLDEKRDYPGYAGTLFPASQVHSVTD